MFRSATLKLTLIYVMLAVVLSVLFSGVIYHFATDELNDALHEQYNTLSANDHDADNVYLTSQEVNKHSNHLLTQLVYFNLVVIGGLAAASYVLAKRTLRPIERAHQAQIRFTAEASHELRTPLAAMRAGTEVALMEKGLDAKTRSTLKANVYDIQKLESLAAHLLDISRFQSTDDNHFELLDLDEIISQSLQQFKQIIKTKRLSVTEQIGPVQILGNGYAIKRLVTIVLDNAIKYSNAGGSLSVKLQAKDKQAVLMISDTGIGIPSGDMSHLFESFFRASNVRASKQQNSGYGLGLSLAQEITKSHKGSIHVSSKEKVGTQITIKLPAVKQ